ncbi:MAG: response regulator transcription factor [Candidatus Eisenbacteria bacterium]|uniref:Response regulator transcription factor n=1 Tax=Eiseniibacteriota bacterium TaxID=2212470 RepID=A0A849SM52_UNCEI|nr:response regulator transcription factor [Candidatus Eisenbacteria bacterium]
MTLRVVLIDDEPLARSGLRALLATQPDLEVVGEAGDGLEAIELIRTRRPDVAFLDVEMPGLDGFGMLERLAREERPWVVFVTAFDAHALRAFQMHALQYVLKPITAEALDAVMERVREVQLGSTARELTDRLERLLREREELMKPGGSAREALIDAATAAASARPTRWLVRSSGTAEVIAIDAVERIEADGDYARLHIGRQVHLHRATMQALSLDLDPRRFARVHRSHIVRIDHVRTVRSEPGGDGAVVLNDGVEVPLSRTYRDAFLSVLEGRPRGES